MTQSGYDHLSFVYVYAIYKAMICNSKKKNFVTHYFVHVLHEPFKRQPMKNSRGYFVTP